MFLPLSLSLSRPFFQSKKMFNTSSEICVVQDFYLHMNGKKRDSKSNSNNILRASNNAYQLQQLYERDKESRTPILVAWKIKQEHLLEKLFLQWRIFIINTRHKNMENHYVLSTTQPEEKTCHPEWMHCVQEYFILNYLP